MSIKTKILLGFLAAGLITVGFHASTALAADCDTSILPGEWCDDSSGNGVFEILNLVLNIMTAGIGILATIGLIVVGIQWMTAKDKEDQIVKAKSRLTNIVLGIVVWGVLWLFLSWLIPGGVINTNLGAVL